MSRTTGMLVGYAGLFAGWTYENTFLVVAGMVILVTEGIAYFKEREEQND